MTTEENFWRAKYARECIKRFQQRQMNPFIFRGPVSNAPPPPADRPQPLHPIPSPIPILTGTPERGTPAEDLLVGIIGAGAAGLYTAMILKDLGIKYEILEGSDRPGGRIFTHRFDSGNGGGGEWNYFDVGAMRYPKIPVMWRVFDLFEKRLGLGDETFIKYKMNCENQFMDYNTHRVNQKQVDNEPKSDWFKDSEGNGGPVPPDFIKEGVVHWLDQCFGPFKKELARNWDEGMKLLMKYDNYSARMFMATEFKQDSEEKPVVEKAAYPNSVINWLERMSTGTGLFDMAFSEMVIDDLQFDYPGTGFLKFGADAPKELEVDWFCLRGGSRVFIDKMISKLSTPIQYRSRVTSIVPISPGLSVTYTTGEARPTKASKTYDYVISTIPLPALRYVNLGRCNLSYAQLEGMRSLRYDSSCKVGIRFSTRWWEALPSGKIVGGQSKTDRIIRTAVFPSYGTDDPNADAVMIASYTWSQDALRIGGLCTGRKHPDERFLVERILEDLADLHDVDFEDLNQQCIDWFAFDWYSDPFALGAFALFGPGQFSNLYPAWGQGAAGGRLLFAGEALSGQHAWVEGALDSAYEAVFKMLEGAGLPDHLDKLKKNWGNDRMAAKDVEEHEKLLRNQHIIGAVFSTYEKHDEKFQYLDLDKIL